MNSVVASHGKIEKTVSVFLIVVSVRSKTCNGTGHCFGTIINDRTKKRGCMSQVSILELLTSANLNKR